MNRFSPLSLLVNLLFSFVAAAQISYTANDFVPEYHGNYQYGANLGAYYFWTDQQLADIAAGNPALDVEGVGVTALRLSLPETFVDYWGYDIRLDAFQHYAALGMTENVVFVGTPAEQHRDQTHYCSYGPSELFANLYEPIWDGGENGTPYNENNFYAAYLWKLVSIYAPYTRYWEVWNEPDFDFVGNSSRPPGDPGNWWEYDPDPCHYALHAPIQHYIRMLRISYEVIKSIAPDDFVTVGGLGYPSFLDLILRQTDNPDQGLVTPEYPLTGGAYFDVLSYHSYPHIDNSLRAWSDDVMGFVYFRNSDRCVDGLLRLQQQFREVLAKHGYDGSVYPEKRWIITESNVPRLQVDEYLGSSEAQANYLIKSAVACQMNGIDQLHVYQLGDIESEQDARSEFHLMGLFTELDSIPQYEQQPTVGGIAYATVSKLLQGSTYHASRTAALQLPNNIRGGAFFHPTAGFTYVLWAVTNQDRSEEASATYTFPASLHHQMLYRREGDFVSRGITTMESATDVSLTGAPSFFQDGNDGNNPGGGSGHGILLQCHPNPFGEQLSITIQLPNPAVSTLSLYDIYGRLVHRFFNEQPLAEGEHTLHLPAGHLPCGLYLLRYETVTGSSVECKVLSAGR